MPERAHLEENSFSIVLLEPKLGTLLDALRLDIYQRSQSIHHNATAFPAKKRIRAWGKKFRRIWYTFTTPQRNDPTVGASWSDLLSRRDWLVLVFVFQFQGRIAVMLANGRAEVN